jgi:uncharacterized heparinase superfamily protein
MSTVEVRGVRPVVCVIDGAGRDLAVADAAVAGRFTHLGVTLDLGVEPDWIAGRLTHDVEWRVEWVKATEGLDLAHAFAVTGDRGYLVAWERLVRSYATQVPVGFERSEVAARRMQHWLYAWQRFRHAGAPTSVDELLAARLHADAAHLEAHLTPGRNHRTIELYALLLVGVAFDDDALARRALDDLAANAACDILPDGVHRERSSDYHLLVLRSLVGAVANARAGGLVVPPHLLAAVQRGCDFALHLQRPDGMTPALSDGDVEDHRPVLTLADDVFDRRDLRWAATLGADGAPPPDRNGVFPVGGYCTLRSGWGDGARAYADERWGVFDCGPLGDGGHGHYDHLAVELWADGHALVLDAGRYTYAHGDDGWRHWFKGTAAHNTVVVDGLDQTHYRPGKPKGATSMARLVHRVADGGVDMVVGTATSPRYDAVHSRALALVGGDHWVVHDRLRADREHDYAVRWHLAPEADGTVEVRQHGDDHVVRAAGVRLTVPRRCGEVVVEQGWIAPTYGVKLPAPVVVLRAQARDVDVVTRIEAAP